MGWLENFLGLAIDNVILNQSYSLTPYYFWPKTEALEQLKLELDSKLWLCQEDKVKILKLAGDVISYWFSNRDLKTANASPSHFTCPQPIVIPYRMQVLVKECQDANGGIENTQVYKVISCIAYECVIFAQCHCRYVILASVESLDKMK